MNKKTVCYILVLALLLCLFAGCDKPEPAGQTAPPASSPTRPEPSPEDEAESRSEPSPSPSPDPVPEITPPAEEPFDPASGTDVVYESETRPPDPASDTDLETD